jgi:general secretion pathway protein E/type IV pilus assembly protein PilB
VYDIVSTLVRNELLDEDAALSAREQLAAGGSIDDALDAALRGTDGRPTNGQAAGAEEKVLRFLAEQFGLPYAELDKAEPPKELLAKFPARILLNQKLLPLADEGDAILVATCRVFDSGPLDELRMATGLELRPAVAPLREIDRAAKRVLGVGADTIQGMAQDDDEIKVIEENDDLDLTADATAAAQDSSIIKFVNQIMAEGLEVRATDVHVEPFENQLRIRYRVDGVLVEAPVPPRIRKYHAAIVSRIKILSHLDIAEKRVPQDGRIRLRVAGREIDLRVSVIPMIHGEAVVLRILDRGETTLGSSTWA